METELDLPPVQALLREFAERHHLNAAELIERERVAIQATSLANIVLKRGYVQVDDRALADPAVGLLLNMLDRNFEHAEAGIVVFVSGCGSSAEVIARAAVESSLNIRYILAGDRAARLQAYFRYYLDGVERQARNWRAQIGGLGKADFDIHTGAIDRRLAANATMRTVVDALGSAGAERWPASIEERFKAVGESLDYRTFYARMSSETHADAEETLRYFVGRLQDSEDLLQAMALETVWTTRLYTHYAVSHFVRAALAYAHSYSLQGVEGLLRGQAAEVERELIDISAHIGAGI